MGSESYQLGLAGEEQAANYLQKVGYKIITRNFRSQQGEIDIIAWEKDFLVFIEVKNYSYKSYGTAIGAISQSKKRSLIHAARTYLYKMKIGQAYCRFDVLAIYQQYDGPKSFELIQNAFVLC